MSISRLRITPTPSNTATITPSITPTLTTCPGICFSGVGTNVFGVVNAILQDVNDPTKMAMVGQFTSLNGVSRSQMVRAYTDGEVDLTFNPGTSFGNTGLSQFPREFVQQADGKYVVVGTFTTFSGVSRNRIARLNNNGTLDTSFVIGTGFTEQTSYAAIDTGGKILVCGLGGNQYSGTPVGMLCRLNTDGSLDTTFNNNVITGTTSQITNKVVRNSDGTYYLSGSFTHSGRANLIKLNSNGTYASTDPFNTSGVGFVGSVNDFEVLSDGKLIVVGDFTQYNGTGTPRGIIRLNANGTKDTSFVSGGYSNYQYEVIVQGSKYISVGFATTYSGIAINNITRINNNGTLDTTWNSGNFTSPTTEDLIQHLYQITGATSDAGYIFCAGFFDSYDGVLTNNIVKMDSNGYAVDCDPISITPTPSNTPTFTPTPSITATITPSTSPCINCYEYSFTASTSGLLSWLDCDGIMTDTFVNNGETYNITCPGARQGSVVGTGTIVQGALCSSTCLTPTPTATNTPTMTITPSNSPTNTNTPTMTQTPSNSPTITPTNTQTSTPTATIGLTPTSTPSNTPTETPTMTSTPTNTNTSTPSSTPPDVSPTTTPTNTATPTQTNTPSGNCPYTIYSHGALIPNCSDYCNNNYLIQTTTCSSQPYGSLSIGDFIYGFAGQSGYLAYSNVSTDTNTGPFIIADVDGTGEILGLYVCSGGSCIPL